VWWWGGVGHAFFVVVMVVFMCCFGGGDNITADKGDVLLATLAIYIYRYYAIV